MYRNSRDEYYESNKENSFSSDDKARRNDLEEKLARNNQTRSTNDVNYGRRSFNGGAADSDTTTRKNYENNNTPKILHRAIDSRGVTQLLEATNGDLDRITNAMKSVQNYVSNESEMEVKSLNIILAPFGHKIQFNSYNRENPVLFKEELELQQNILHLRDAFFNCVKEIAECFEQRKNAYFQQLKHLRETSNTATRTALQMERSDTFTIVAKLKSDYEKQYREQVGKLESELETQKKHNFQLEETLLSQQEYIRALEEKDKQRAYLQEKAVDEAIQRYQHLMKDEIAQQRQTLREEMQNIRLDYEKQLQRSELLCQQRIDEVTRVEKEKREYILQDRQRIQEETNQLREQVSRVSIEAGLSKEKLIAQLREEAAQAEATLQNQLTHAIQSQAELKSQFAAMMQSKQREVREVEDRQQAVSKQLTERLAADHAMHLQKVQDQHYQAMRDYEAELNVRVQDQLTKMKHFHEQELKRYTRENERLQQLLHRTTHSAAAPLDVNPQHQGYGSLTPNQKQQQAAAQGLSSPLAMRTKVYFQDDTASSPINIQRDFNKTSNSTTSVYQDSAGPVFSPDHLPPTDFVLNEALAGTQHNHCGTGGLGITGNSQRVTSYMKALEDYLQGHDKPQYSLEKAMAGLQMKKSDLVPNSLRSADSSPNSDANNSQTRSSDHDSSSDLFGANLAANLSESIIQLSANS